MPLRQTETSTEHFLPFNAFNWWIGKTLTASPKASSAVPKTCVHYYLCNNLYKAALHFDFCLHACTCAHAVLDVQWAPSSIRLSYLHCTSWLCISHLCCRAKVKAFTNKYKFSGPHPSHKQAMMLQNPHLLHHHRYILPASPRRIHHQGNTGTSWTINRILALRTLTWIIWVSASTVKRFQIWWI